MVDSLSRKLTTGKNVGIIPGISPSVGVENINHALFTNDTLLLGGASLNMERAFSDIMNQFYIISGALINIRKSVVYYWNVDQLVVANITQILGFEGFATWDKVKYLGLPLTLGKNNPSLWLDIIGKLKAKIASWGGHWLTKARKFIVIKPILSALPIYQSYLLLALKKIMDKISKLLRDFLWRGWKNIKTKCIWLNGKL